MNTDKSRPMEQRLDGGGRKAKAIEYVRPVLDPAGAQRSCDLNQTVKNSLEPSVSQTEADDPAVNQQTKAAFNEGIILFP